jgi:ubiquinone/menaquinone biosynthesis C-methylase UbiE
MPTGPLTTPDGQAIKAHWQAKAAHWTDWADGMAAMAARFNQPLLDAIKLSSGERVLDLASGAGEPALSAAARVAPDGLVVASDLIADMVRGVKSRAGTDPLYGVAADMQALPFADGAFDKLTCRFGIMFVPDPLCAAQQAARVLRSGGRAGFLVWGPRADQTIFTVLGDAVAEVLGLAMDDHHFQIFRFGNPGSLSHILEAAGLRHVQEEALHFTPTAPADKPFWRPQLDMSFGHLLDGISDADSKALDARIREKLAPLRSKDGRGYRLKAHIRLVTGRAP